MVGILWNSSGEPDPKPYLFGFRVQGARIVWGDAGTDTASSQCWQVGSRVCVSRWVGLALGVAGSLGSGLGIRGAMCKLGIWGLWVLGFRFGGPGRCATRDLGALGFRAYAEF